jgi:hypothetical protein
MCNLDMDVGIGIDDDRLVTRKGNPDGGTSWVLTVMAGRGVSSRSSDDNPSIVISKSQQVSLPFFGKLSALSVIAGGST